MFLKRPFAVLGLLSALAVAPIGPSSTDAQDQTKAPGIPIGQKAPEFTLNDQEGKNRGLSEFLGQDQMVALVFYRSADW